MTKKLLLPSMQWEVKMHQKNIEGLNIFLKENKSKEDFCIYLYGDENKINQEIKRLNVPTKSLKSYIQKMLFQIKKLL